MKTTRFKPAPLLLTTLLGSVMVLGIHTSGEARQFRQFTPIAAPDENSATAGQAGQPAGEVRQLSREEVEPMVRQVIEQWNTSAMADTLAADFHDKNRLLDAVDTVVPRDAKLRIQSIQGVQTLQQFNLPASDGGRGEQVSIVSATVQTQLEFTGSNGLTRLQGTNEFILEISQAAPP